MENTKKQSSDPKGFRVIPWDKIIFFIMIFVCVFGYGIFTGHAKLFPYSLLTKFNQQVQLVKMSLFYLKHTELTNLLFVEPVSEKLNNNGAAITGSSKERMVLLTGFWEMSHDVRLLDETGSLINTWHVDYDKVWSKPDHVKNQLPNLERHLNGAILYEDGSVVINFEFGGLVKLDWDSNIIWKLPHATHHSIYQADNGNLWVCGGRMHDETLPDFPNVLPPFWEDLILEIDPDGNIIQEISLFDVIANSDYEGAIFGNGENRARYHHDVELDLLHLNDIEILSSEIADQFEQFNAGDILVSLRNINTLMVIDGKTELVKWSMTGPFLRQHDPDFSDDGRILVFDNNTVNASVIKGKKAGQGSSRILAIDPVTRSVDTIYEGTDDTYFFSRLMGRVHQLPDEHYLITETLQGRVFEIGPEGDILWTYTNWWDENEVAWIEDAVPYPKDYLTEISNP